MNQNIVSFRERPNKGIKMNCTLRGKYTLLMTEKFVLIINICKVQ